MDDRRKATLFAVLAAMTAAGSAVVDADQSAPHVAIVLPLVGVAVLLFFAGYYAGSAKNHG